MAILNKTEGVVLCLLCFNFQSVLRSIKQSLSKRRSERRRRRSPVRAHVIESRRLQIGREKMAEEEEEEGKKENVNTSLEPLLFFSFSNVGERPGVGNSRISRSLRVASRQARLKTASECRFPRKKVRVHEIRIAPLPFFF